MFDFPSAPVVGAEYTSAGVTYVFNGTGWTVKASGGGTPVDAYTKAESDANFVNIPGDTMTGPLTTTALSVVGATGANLNLDDSAGNTSVIWGKAGGLTKWQIHMPETGSGHFAVTRFDAAGANINPPALIIDRATGNVTMNGNVQINGYCWVDGSDGIIVNKLAVGNWGSAIIGKSLSVNRWSLVLGDVTPESGSNSGSDVRLVSYDDVGTEIGIALEVKRSSRVLRAVNGYACQPGMSSPATGNSFSIAWSGVANLWIDSTDCGQITLVSDYRIKKDVVDLGSTWDAVKALRPISYTIADYTPLPKADEEVRPLFAADDVERWGFIAHELQETLVQSAATGVKDQENCIQSPNPMTVIAALTKALQEAMQRIEDLEARVAQPR